MMIDSDPVDRPLRRLRIATALTVFAIAMPTMFETSPTATVAMAAGMLVLGAAFAEPSLRSRFGRRRSSVATLALDLGAILLALAVAGVESGEPASFAIALPLVAAGIRHALLGVVIAWAAAAFAIVIHLAVTWDGTPGQVTGPLQLCVVLIVVALPAAHLSHIAAQRAQAFTIAQHSLESAPARPASSPQPLATLLAGPDFGHLVYDRQGIAARLAARRLEAPVSVALVGLDDLKLLNDLHGRATGDALITRAVDRLATSGGQVDVGWMGGDELMLIAEASSGLTSALRVCFETPIDLGVAGSRCAQVAIGAATGSPEVSGPQLTRAATEAMVEDRRAQNARFLDQFESLVADVSIDTEVVR